MNVTCAHCMAPVPSHKKFCSTACSNRFRCIGRTPTNANSEDDAKRLLWGELVDATEGGCWVMRQAKRYGVFHYQGSMWLAHRLSYFLANGVHPGDLLVMHSCDNPPCVNPAHLSLGTVQDNSDDMVAKGRSCRGRRRPGTGPAGERNIKAKLTREQVDSLRQEYASGRHTYRSIAAKYGIRKSQVGNILTRSQWKE